MSQRGGAVSHELITATASLRETIETQGQSRFELLYGSDEKVLGDSANWIDTNATHRLGQPARESHTIACNSRVAYVL